MAGVGREGDFIKFLAAGARFVMIRQIRPKKAILTHFGMTMLKAKPRLLAEGLSKKLKTEVIAAYDGMKLVL